MPIVNDSDLPEGLLPHIMQAKDAVGGLPVHFAISALMSAMFDVLRAVPEEQQDMVFALVQLSVSAMMDELKQGDTTPNLTKESEI